MRRHVARSIAAAAVAVVLYACGSTSPADPPAGIDSGTGDPDTGTSSGDATTTPDQSTVTDGAGDVTVDSPSDTGVDAPPPAPAVRFVGRVDESDAVNGPRLSWPGSRIIARFDGTAVDVTLFENELFGGGDRWDVLVDDVRTMTLAPAPGLGTYSVASGLAPGVHKIELYKRTEGLVGNAYFKSFDFPGGGKLLAPPATPARRIVFLSDSTTTGNGNECTGPTETFTSATQNERLGYAGLTAAELGADHHNISWSGKGVLLNNNPGDTVVMETIFLRSRSHGPEDWVFSKFVPDVVWLMLGSNDWEGRYDGTPATEPGPDFGAFRDKYLALVALVRSKYPSAHIFGVIAPSMNNDYPPTRLALTNMRNALTEVVAARVALGDTKFYKYEFTRAVYPGEQTGCAYHVNLAKHRTMADEAKTQIKAKTGWP